MNQPLLFVALFVVAIGVMAGFAWISVKQLRERGHVRLWLTTAQPQQVNRLLLSLLLYAALSLGLVWLGYTRLQARLAVLAAGSESATTVERR